MTGSGWREDLAADALPSGAEVLHTACVGLSPEARSPGSSRAFVRAQVRVDEDTLDTLLLLTSELVTNAVIHARTDLEVSVAVTATDVVVAVHDLDLGRREPEGTGREGGRGLLLVRDLASSWGQTRHADGGKSVWFRVALAGGAAS